jgi:hypothetical protein
VKRLQRKPLLLASIIFVALYWSVGAFAANPYVSSAASLALLLAGVLTLASYAKTTYRILFLDLRSHEVGGEGSHLAIYGATLLAAGAVYDGLFWLLWVYFGQPPDWTGTATSSFGRAVMVVGFWLLYVGPEPPNTSTRSYSIMWIFTLVSVAVLVGIIAGMNMAPF